MGTPMRPVPPAAVAVAVLAALATACGSGSSTSRTTTAAAPAGQPAAAAQRIDPKDFVRRVDNPWFPLRPGTTYHWRGTQNGKSTTDVFSVTGTAKRIQGVRTTVIHDRVYLEGRLHESTVDWYAQDRKGNVWYFGEATRSLDRRGHVVSTGGSWQAGVDGAEAGIFMPGHPRTGQTFRQEYYKGHAEDTFRITSMNASVRVPFVSSRHAIRTIETTPLEPGVVDEKRYVRGVGTVLEATVKGPDKERLELVRVTRR
jgi:hypothetical protein